MWTEIKSSPIMVNLEPFLWRSKTGFIPDIISKMLKIFTCFKNCISLNEAMEGKWTFIHSVWPLFIQLNSCHAMVHLKSTKSLLFHQLHLQYWFYFDIPCCILSTIKWSMLLICSESCLTFTLVFPSERRKIILQLKLSFILHSSDVSFLFSWLLFKYLCPRWIFMVKCFNMSSALLFSTAPCNCTHSMILNN